LFDSNINGLPNEVRKREFSFVLTSVRNSEEIAKVARIEVCVFMVFRSFMVREAANNAKFYKQERLYCRTAV
jgi:hypothetical protein